MQVSTGRIIGPSLKRILKPVATRSMRQLLLWPFYPNLKCSDYRNRGNQSPQPTNSSMLLFTELDSRIPVTTGPVFRHVIRLKVLAPGFDLYWAIPFLALPCIRSFQCPRCIGGGDGHESSSSRYLHNDFKSSLELVELTRASIDEVAIADFLQRTPCLRTLRYSHSTRGHAPQDWNLSQFGTAIERTVGDHLKQLSVSINKDELRGSILPGKASMRGFQQLQRLELPLEIVADQLDDSGLLLEDLLPVSVSHLSFIAQGTSRCAKALDTIIHQFLIKRSSQTPGLQRIYLTWFYHADDSYKEQCTKLAVEAEKAGVTLELTWPGPAWK